MRVPFSAHHWSTILFLSILTLATTVPAATATTATSPATSTSATPHPSHSSSIPSPIKQSSHHSTPILTHRHSQPTPPNFQSTSNHFHATNAPTIQVTVILQRTDNNEVNATYYVPTPKGFSHTEVTVPVLNAPKSTHLQSTIDWVEHGTANRSNGAIHWDGKKPFVFRLTLHQPVIHSVTQTSGSFQHGSFIYKGDLMAEHARGNPPPPYINIQTQFKARGTHLHRFNLLQHGHIPLFYLGNATIKNTTTDNETITLVLPHRAAKDIQANKLTPAQLLNAYRTEAHLLQVDVKPAHIIVFAYPSQDRPVSSIIGGIEKRGIIRVWANQSLATTESSWLHEFVHTHQYMAYHRTPRIGSQMRWYREADANYYADLVAYNEHRISFHTLWQSLHSQNHRQFQGRLANTSTWKTHQIEYQRGPLILEYLDARIRRHTHGNASFLTVMRTINTQEKYGQNLTLTRFKHDLEQYLPKKTVNHAVHAYIKGNQTVPVSTRYAAYSLPPTRINTSRPVPPTGMNQSQYQAWQHRNTTNATTVRPPNHSSHPLRWRHVEGILTRDSHLVAAFIISHIPQALTIAHNVLTLIISYIPQALLSPHRFAALIMSHIIEALVAAGSILGVILHRIR